MAIESPLFKVDSRAVRDRYNLLSQKLRKKLKDEEKASGIDTEMSESETALEEIIEKEDASQQTQDCESDGNRKAKEQERVTAQDMRKKAMERMGQTQKRRVADQENEEGKKKRISSGTDTLVYLREKNDIDKEMKREELQLKRMELEQQREKHDDFMNVILLQQEQQAKQAQEFQRMMLTMMSRFTQK